MPEIRASVLPSAFVLASIGALLSCSESHVGVCVPACGEGLSCVAEGTDVTCRPDDPDAIAVRILSPENDRLQSDPVVDVECEATAPQLEQVALRIIPPPPEPELVAPARDLGDGRWGIRYTSAMGAALDGTHVFRCEARFGPPAYGNVVRSGEQRVHVDRSPPSIEHDTSERWYPPDAEVRITATIREPASEGAAAGLDRSSVLLVLGEDLEIPPTTADADVFEFVLDLATLLPTDFVGTVPSVLTAADRLGNRTSSPHALWIDSVAPRVTVDRSVAEQWHPLGDSELRIPVEVERGPRSAPLAGPPAAHDEAGRLLATAEKEGDAWVLPFLPSALAGAGEEVAIEWVVSAKNVAGLVGFAAGILRIDDRPPSVTATESTTWTRRGELAEIELDAFDLGSGIDPTSFFAGESLAPAECMSMGDTSFRCSLPTSDAPDEIEGVHVVPLSVVDRVGNVQHVDVAVLVDATGPVLSPGWEADAWLPSAERAVVPVRATDAGTGTSRVYVVTQDTELDCDADADGLWLCFVDTSHVEESTANHTVLVRAEDGLGNVTEWAAVVAVDAQAPTIAFDDPSEWFDPAGPARLRFGVEDSDSGVARVSVEWQDELVECERAEESSDSEDPDHLWECAVLAPPLDDGEWQLPYVVRAMDAAGLIAEQEGTIRFDSLPPTVAFPKGIDWVTRSGLVPVAVSVVDAGSGVAVDAVHVEDDGETRACEVVTGDAFECLVDATLVPEGTTTELPFRILAADRLGNLRTEPAVLPVDDEGPSIALGGGFDTWLSMENHQVWMTVTDAGVGIESPVAATTLVPIGAGATSNEPVQSAWFGPNDVRFLVHGASFLPAERTLADFPFELTAVDLLGNETVQTVYLSFDGEAPYLHFLGYPYPTHNGGWLVRNAGEIELKALVLDPGRDPFGFIVNGSGIHPGRVELQYQRANGTTGVVLATNTDDQTWVWKFDPRVLPLDAVEDEIAIRFEASDNAGNTFGQTIPLRLTRRVWDQVVSAAPLTSWGPALAGDQLFVAAYGSTSEIVALDARTGQVQWRTPLENPTLQHLLVDDELVYATSGTDGLAKLLGFQRRPEGGEPKVERQHWTGAVPTGRLAYTEWIWTVDRPRVPTVLIATRSGVRAAWTDGVSFNVLGIDSGETYGLSVDGRRIWHGAAPSKVTDYDPINRVASTTELPSSPGHPYSYALVNGGAWANDGGTLISWSEQLEILKVGYPVVPANGAVGFPVVGLDFSPWWVSPRNTLFRFSPQLEPLPGFPVTFVGDASEGMHTPTLGEDGTAYVVVDGWVHAIREDGSLSWVYDLGVRGNILEDSPLLGCDGTLYVGTLGGRMVALATDSRGLADGWPRAHRDNRNSNSTFRPLRVDGQCVD